MAKLRVVLHELYYTAENFLISLAQWYISHSLLDLIISKVYRLILIQCQLVPADVQADKLSIFSNDLE